MKKTITIYNDEIESILKKHFGINKDIDFYFLGGIVNPKEIKITYFE